MDEIKVLNIDTKEIESIEADFQEVMSCINDNKEKCKLYTSSSYYCVYDDEREVLVKIDNSTKNLVSFTQDNLRQLFGRFKDTSNFKICFIKSAIPKNKFAFNVRSSLGKYLFDYKNGKIGLVTTDVQDINNLRSIVYRTGNEPRKLLMWELMSVPCLGSNKIVGIDFIDNKFIDIDENLAEKALKIYKLSKDYENFRKYFLEVSGFQLSDGKEPPVNEFDFISTSDTDLEIRKKVVKDGYYLVKDKILCNGHNAIGATSKKFMDAVFLNKFISRMVMVYKHHNLIPSFSIINYNNMFGFYPIWYLHPDLKLYGDGMIKNLIECLDLIDSENIYDNEEEVLDVWKYFVPYYMSDDWEKYLDVITEEKSRLSGYEGVLIKELVSEKDFIDFMLVNKLEHRPKQLTNIVQGKVIDNSVHFKPGKVPSEYLNALKGRRCNLYLFREQRNDEIFMRDCVNLETVRVSDLGNSYRDNVFKTLCRIMIDCNLIFTKVNPLLYVLELEEYVFKMSQQGAVYVEKNNGVYDLSVPIILSDDLFYTVQVKRFDCMTGRDKDYNLMYGKEVLPELIERAMYRNRHLDKFTKETAEDIELFGTRRKPKVEEMLQNVVDGYKDLRDVFNFFSGSNLMQWVRMGARGGSSDSTFLDSADWDRIIWFCKFNTWLAYIEMAKRDLSEGRKEDLELVVCDNYDSRYYYRVYEFYCVGDVCMIKADFSGKPWRLCVDCYPMQYIDVTGPIITELKEEKIYGQGKGSGIFIIEFNDSDILYRGDSYIIIECEGNRYLISGEDNQAKVVENRIIHNLDRGLIKSLESIDLFAYEYVFRNFMVSHIYDIEEVSENLFKLQYYDFGNKNLGNLSNFRGSTLLLEFWCYVGKIIYVFKCDETPGRIIEIFEDNKNILLVDSRKYVWNYKKNMFTEAKGVETKGAETEGAETEEVETEGAETVEDKETAKSNYDWLYNFNTHYFDN